MRRLGVEFRWSVVDSKVEPRSVLHRSANFLYVASSPLLRSGAHLNLFNVAHPREAASTSRPHLSQRAAIARGLCRIAPPRWTTCSSDNTCRGRWPRRFSPAVVLTGRREGLWYLAWSGAPQQHSWNDAALKATSTHSCMRWVEELCGSLHRHQHQDRRQQRHQHQDQPLQTYSPAVSSRPDSRRVDKGSSHDTDCGGVHSSLLPACPHSHGHMQD